MRKVYLKVKSLTLAMKGSEILKKSGYNTKVYKSADIAQDGCGYCISVVDGDVGKAIELLKANGIKVIGRVEQRQ